MNKYYVVWNIIHSIAKSLIQTKLKNRIGTIRIKACGDRKPPTDFSFSSWLSLKQEAHSFRKG
ncbi:MAG: hypothetical protein KC589_01815 [Nanoarchaeota archaeon]|nr:hypothetical protein [Nanoarchaeota archaeon]